MKPVHSCNFILLTAFLAATPAAGEPPPVPSLSPSRADVERARAAFLKISRPLAYKYVVDRKAQSPFGYALSHIELFRDAKEFAKKTPATDLIYALWPFLTNHTYDAEAFIILQGALEPKMAGDWGLNFLDAAHPGTWPQSRRYAVAHCQWLCRSALGQPEWWYPHPVLFDRGRVLAESKTNAVVRAAHIEAMVKALADPKIRTENPLEANNILLILDALKAREAVQTFVDYMFYDWRTGGDYRLREGDLIPPPRYDPNKPNNLSQVQLPAFMYLPRLGDVSVPLVLRRLANATEEERSVEIGGGAAPAIAVKYFMWLRFTEQQALDAIADFQSKEEELSTEQKAALAEVTAAILEKKYRFDALLKNSNPIVRTWAPSFTNAPPISRP